MEDIRQSFCKKIYDEFQQFRVSMLRKSKDDIFGEAYKIDVFVNLYEILMEKSEVLSDAILRNLLCISGILEILYECWLKKEDSCFSELLQHVEDEIEKRKAA